MRARFLSSGSHDFADHELLELLLFYSLPRKNTNELAHSLIERFGSLRRVAAADVDELSSVTGIGKNTAALIKLTLELAARYERELFLPSKSLKSIDTAISYARSLFLGATSETVYLVLLDNEFMMLDCRPLSQGTVNEVKPIVREILERSVLKKASLALMLHNHPDGDHTPSSEDVEFTYLVNHELEALGVRLVDHIIVGQNNCSLITNSPDGASRADQLFPSFYKRQP